MASRVGPQRNWYQIEIAYETMAGEMKTGRTPPIRDLGKAMSTLREYQRTGFKVRMLEIPAPRKEPAKPKPTRKVGSHE